MFDINIQTLDHAEFAALSEELMKHAGGIRFRAAGRSMLPTIHDGDVLTLVKIDARELAVGDIVLFQDGERGRVLMHRIISVSEHTFTACGDASCQQDAPFPAEKVIGRVCMIEHCGKDSQPPRLWGCFMAFVSRHSTSMWARNLKRLMRYLASTQQRPTRSRPTS